MDHPQSICKSEYLKALDRALDAILREGAQCMLQAAIEAEVLEYIDAFKRLLDEAGRRLIVRNGHLPEQEILTGAGPLTVKKPRVNDRRDGHRFTSQILPSYLRRSPSIDALIPVLYLKGISTSDFQEALEAILGDSAARLSPANIVRLKEGWSRSTRTGQSEISQASGTCICGRMASISTSG